MHKGGFKETFVFVAGITPQIITETIYALSQQKPPVHPDELFVITTETGKQHIVNSLIRKGILAQLGKEYGIPNLTLDEASFLIVKDKDGSILDDIRNKSENEVMGDLVTSFIREKTMDPSARLHCSIAGGRKTMSFYMGAALQLFGRPWDRLYHVLVTPEFESNPSFFYKPKRNRLIEVKYADGNKKQVSTRQAEIQLAELPFIRLRDKLALTGKTFREMVSEGQQKIDTALVQPDLDVNLFKRSITINNRHTVKLTPVQFVLYLALVRRKLSHCHCTDRPYCIDCTQCFLTLIDLTSEGIRKSITEDYRRLYGGNQSRAEELYNKWKNNTELPNIIRQNISKINKTIAEHVADKTLLPYCSVTSIKQYGSTRYGISIDKNKVQVR